MNKTLFSFIVVLIIAGFGYYLLSQPTPVNVITKTNTGSSESSGGLLNSLSGIAGFVTGFF